LLVSITVIEEAWYKNRCWLVLPNICFMSRA
jgi:hypothetical protein